MDPALSVPETSELGETALGVRRDFERTASAGEAIFEAGEPADAFYVVLAGEVVLLDEEVRFDECLMRAGYPMEGQLVAGVHNGMLSPATFRMKGVSRHTGSFRIPGVMTRGET